MIEMRSEQEITVPDLGESVTESRVQRPPLHDVGVDSHSLDLSLIFFFKTWSLFYLNILYHFSPLLPSACPKIPTTVEFMASFSLTVIAVACAYKRINVEIQPDEHI